VYTFERQNSKFVHSTRI